MEGKGCAQNVEAALHWYCMFDHGYDVNLFTSPSSQPQISTITITITRCVTNYCPGWNALHPAATSTRFTLSDTITFTCHETWLLQLTIIVLLLTGVIHLPAPR
jgi:hypothetical protein